MALQTYYSPPPFEAPQWDPDKANASVLNRDAIKWGGLAKNGTATPPAIGAEVYVTMNKLGPATVRGYFVVDNWLGVLVEFKDPPQWWIDQNPTEPLGHIFGPEFRIVE